MTVAPEHPAQRQPGQWRLAEVQLYNWGTFTGLHRVPIARQGHLITGPSGSGKSSLLDAIAVVLTPDRWLRLNDAAQGAQLRGQGRTQLSYVRGAWSKGTDDQQDRIVSRYLRPRATASGILLRYDDGLGASVTLARLFHIAGTSTDAAELRDVSIADRGALDLGALIPHAKNGIETRRLKDVFPKAAVATRQSSGAFYARLQSLLGIESPNALQLLHKTQSAKNLGSLDQLFRTFMLDRPATFDRADQAQAQFGELDAAHRHVVELRRQRDALRALATSSARYDEMSAQAAATSTLLEAIPGYESRELLRLAKAERGEAELEHARAEDEARTYAELEHAADQSRQEAALREAGLGGSDQAALARELADVEAQLAATSRNHERLAAELSQVGIGRVPRTASEYAELRVTAEKQLAENTPGGLHTHAAHDAFAEARREVRQIDDELAILRTSRSNIDPRLQQERARLAHELGVSEKALPFAGELLEVLPEHAEWTGAIERVLRPLSTALLVRDEHLDAVRSSIDGRHLGARLVIEAVGVQLPSPRAVLDARSLVNRVRVAPGGFHDWLVERLARRFDFACVDSPLELDDHERAVTVRGQVKLADRRYEKDDRFRIDDRRTWVLGGDNELKIEALLAARREAEERMRLHQAELDAHEEAARKTVERHTVLRQLRTRSWSEYETAPIAARLERLRERKRDHERTSPQLAEASAAHQAAKQAHEKARAEAARAQQVLLVARARLDEIDRVVAVGERELVSGAVTTVAPEVATALDERYRALRRRVERTTLGEIGRIVQSKLRDERDVATTEAERAARAFTAEAARFAEHWPAASADLTDSIDDRGGYRLLLEQIESHGLPEHEANFLRLLREKSSNLIGYLLKDLRDAPDEIKERVAPVNASLLRSEFEPERFLQIRVRTQRSETVTTFIGQLRSIVDGTWDDADATAAEKRFAVLAELMRRLASSDTADRNWRAQVLDTREHVAFHAQVIDRAGRESASYDSGAALSGGQQQKLVVFCLAAALRYQLTDADAEVPAYGTVVLDEAFDKADSSYTRMAMNIFTEFGFHMILATPQKLLQTLEPYVGAVTAVANPTQQASQLANATFERVETV